MIYPDYDEVDQLSALDDVFESLCFLGLLNLKAFVQSNSTGMIEVALLQLVADSSLVVIRVTCHPYLDIKIYFAAPES